MKRLILFTVLASIMMTANAQLEWGDQGDGTFVNPVLNADFSDPDVIRVGTKYYMVASDFHFIGMQVLESDDMVNWRYVSQVYSRFDEPGWDSNQHYAGGSWAPAIRYHEGKFYIYFCTPEEGLYMTTATDARGPWSPLHLVKRIAKWEDPCPFWDEDGQAYLGRSRHGAGPIIVHRMSPDGKQLLDDGVTVYTGPVAEGTKFLKRNGYYYLIIPEGGVGQGWQTVLRSKDIYGPYERRIVLERGTTQVNGPHQGALVDTPDGNWWFYHFQETPVLGRVVHLQPAGWQDDWPYMGVDLDGNGVGEPVSKWQCPLPQTKEQQSASCHEHHSSTHAQNCGIEAREQQGASCREHHSSAHNQNCVIDSREQQGASCREHHSSAHAQNCGIEAREQQGASCCKHHSSTHAQNCVIAPREDFNESLGLQWQWNHNPVDEKWNLTEREGWLTLHALTADSLKACRNMLTQKVVGYLSESTTLIEVDGNCYSGVFCSGKQFLGVGLCPQGLFIESNGKRTLVKEGKMTKMFLRVTNDSRLNQHQFSYSTDGIHFTPIGQPFPMRSGYWKGIRVGLFCYGQEGKAQFQFFRQEVLK
ncbi:MAG: glycoside hydrolase 43 family protein [Prevotella sp.]|nr:glycoside hydrolase 43 family protein [Prevotella sp.]